MRIREEMEYWLLGTTALFATGTKEFPKIFLLTSRDGGGEYWYLLIYLPISLINMELVRVDIFWDQKIIPRIRIRTMVSQGRPQNYLFLSKKNNTEM